ncbi:MAG: protein kinase [Planctomycetaceae bacterium]|nr:protein kinase [Planctomycetaceae bacterium]
MTVSGFDSNCSPRTGSSKNSCDSVLGSERTLSDQTAALAANAVARSESPVLGGYEILRELGRGGMGVVYEAIQRSLGRRVALKILPGGGVVDKVTMQRFQLEAAAAARLQHPNIVSVIEVGTEHDVHYYAMQFIDGRTLLGVTADPLQGQTGCCNSPTRWNVLIDRVSFIGISSLPIFCWITINS